MSLIPQRLNYLVVERSRRNKNSTTDSLTVVGDLKDGEILQHLLYVLYKHQASTTLSHKRCRNTKLKSKKIKTSFSTPITRNFPWRIAQISAHKPN
jgi:hypothetical protein